MTITCIPSLRTMSSKTFKVLKQIIDTPMRRTGLGRGSDEWTSKIIDNLAAAGYIKREPDGSYAATAKGIRTVANKFERAAAIEKVAAASMPITNRSGAIPGQYTGHELTAPAVRPGADDHFQHPSRRPDGLYYRDGRVEALPA